MFFLPSTPIRNGELRAIHASARAAPTTIASLELPDGIGLMSEIAAADITRAGPQLVVVRTDGFLVVLDAQLKPTTATADGEFPLPGMRIGGWYTGPYGYGPVPIAANLGDSSDSILASTSSGALRRIEG